MIKIKEMIPQTAEFFDPNGKFLGTVNFDQFNDLRIQIKEEKAEGYYCLFKGEKIFINEFGQVINHKNGFFDLIDDQLNKLLNL